MYTYGDNNTVSLLWVVYINIYLLEPYHPLSYYCQLKCNIVNSDTHHLIKSPSSSVHNHRILRRSNRRAHVLFMYVSNNRGGGGSVKVYSVNYYVDCQECWTNKYNWKKTRFSIHARGEIGYKKRVNGLRSSLQFKLLWNDKPIIIMYKIRFFLFFIVIT